LCLLSLAGIPPLAGFVSKVFIFTAAWSQGFAWLVVIALINTVISLVYYGRIVKAMYFDAPLKEDHLTTPVGLSSTIALTTTALIVITIAAQAILLLANPAASSLLAFLPGK
jgi:NADH-quinone oxidoreductase subunit N